MVKENKKHTHHKHKKHINFFKEISKTFIWVGVFTFIILCIIPLAFVVSYHSKIYPNILVGPYNLSGKTKAEANQFLNTNYNNNSGFLEFQFIYQDKAWAYKSSDWKLSLNIQKTVDQAYQIGRSRSGLENIINIFSLYKKPIQVPLELNYDANLLSATIESIANELNSPMIEPSLFVEKSTITLSPGTEGRKLDNKTLEDKIIQVITYNETAIIQLPVITLTPSASKEQEEETKKRAEKLLSKKLKLTIGENVHDVENGELISLISFSNSFDGEKIASLSSNLALAFDTKPQDAAFNFENGRVTVFKPGKDGQILNQEKAISLLNEQLIQLEATTSAALSLSLPIENTPPEISTDEVNDLGIRELLGRGVSYFRGSIASRIHNIVLASSRLNGLLIKPGETFSFNNAVGDISAATGYQQAYIIQNGRTVLGDGGGVCQVSTTLFRAALNSGLPIVARTAHAYRVSYYEQGFGAGLDATVFSPSVDLKIKNDTPAHILIQTIVDPENSTLIFELYGSSDGRQAILSKPRVWDQVAPPPPKYEDDPTLPAGQEKQVDFAAWGAKAAFDYKVVRNGETLIDKTFYSNFRPWQAVFLKGTKT